MLEVGSDCLTAEYLCYWTTHTMFCASFTVYQFSPHVASKPRGVMPPSLVLFGSTFIIDETFDGRLAKFEVFSAKFFRSGEKNFRQ